MKKRWEVNKVKVLKNHLSGFGALKSREKNCQGFNLKQTELCREEDCWVVVSY